MYIYYIYVNLLTIINKNTKAILYSSQKNIEK